MKKHRKSPIHYEVSCAIHGKNTEDDVAGTFHVTVGVPANPKTRKDGGCPKCKAEAKLSN